jgi:hypothetical protein
MDFVEAKIVSKNSFEDINDVYPGTITQTVPNYVQLPNQKFLVTQDLMTFFPPELLNDSNAIIGMPDASDGGGLYIEYNFNGIHKKWQIDQFQQNVPQRYHTFMDKVNEKINQLQ